LTNSLLSPDEPTTASMAPLPCRCPVILSL
jgi:hypothetical protein